MSSLRGRIRVELDVTYPDQDKTVRRPDQLEYSFERELRKGKCGRHFRSTCSRLPGRMASPAVSVFRLHHQNTYEPTNLGPLGHGLQILFPLLRPILSNLLKLLRL